ncbi:MAG: ATP-binding protein [Devosia sp.]
MRTYMAMQGIKVIIHTGSVEIVSGGPVVPPQTMQQLIVRFARGKTDSQGSGLGLAIVDTLMNQAGGYLRLASPAPDRIDGFSALLDFRN